MKKEHEKILWIGVAAASFFLAVCLSIGMIFAVHFGVLKGEEGLFIRYVISIALGASTATLTVGALRAKASITGKKLGTHIELGGASAVLALTVFGAFYFTSNPSFNQGFYFEDSVTERKIASESMKVVLNLDTGPVELTVGPNGFLEFKNLPTSLSARLGDGPS